ncbi:MAG: hypothetical protein JSR91_00165 [Proteobacteria bacterium]|nr:hypothetical protein [Pseudomonadota bacterium]
MLKGVYACQQYDGQEEIADDAVEVMAFFTPRPATSITNAQLKRQLDADGKLAAARTAVNATDGLAEELWYGAAIFLRSDPLLLQLATAMGYDTEAKLEAFFESARKL